MLKKLIAFLKARDGLAAIEFAFIAPVMGTMLLGTVEVCNALQCRQKVASIASSVSDLVAQTTSVSSGDIGNIFSAANAIVYPFPSSASGIVITSIVSDGTGNGKVAWSQAQNATALAVNTEMTVPAGLMPAATCPSGACSVIFTQVSYGYTSPLGKMIVGTLTMKDYFYARPRQSATVAYTG
jgi:Flp pilus assembly protein TadG